MNSKECEGCPHYFRHKDQFGWSFGGCHGGSYNGKWVAEIEKCPMDKEKQDARQ